MKIYIKIPITRIRRHKRHFQLLELMVAAFILLICIAPAMRIFTSMYQSQQEIIRENQRDHLAHQIHGKMTELFYKRQIHFSENTKDQPISFHAPEITDLLQKFSYQCQVFLEIVDSTKPQNSEHPNKYLGHIMIKLKDVSPQAQSKLKNKKFENQDPTETIYDYSIYIDAGARANKSDKEKNKKEEEETQPDSARNKNKKPSPQDSSIDEEEKN